MGAAAQPPRVSSASGAATRGRMRLEREVFYTPDMIVVVKKSCQISILPPPFPSPEEREDVGPTTIGAYAQCAKTAQ
jgi:hypothetical protein